MPAVVIGHGDDVTPAQYDRWVAADMARRISADAAEASARHAAWDRADGHSRYQCPGAGPGQCPGCDIVPSAVPHRWERYRSGATAPRDTLAQAATRAHAAAVAAMIAPVLGTWRPGMRYCP